MDVFHIDWLHLGDAHDTFGSKADNHLKVIYKSDFAWNWSIHFKVIYYKGKIFP